MKTETLKRVVKKIIPPLLLCLYRERKYFNIIRNYNKGRRNFKKSHNVAEFPKVIFIVQFPEVWNSVSTIYEALESLGAVPMILCLPKPAFNFTTEYVADNRNEAHEFFEKMKIPAINAYDICTNTWFDLKKERPDYVVYMRPYNNQYPVQYKNTYVCDFAKVCYIPYAYSQTSDGLSYTTFNEEFILATYVTFTPSRIRLNDCKKRFALQRLTKSHKFIFKGFPRFDLLDTCDIENDKRNYERKTILWLPRWTVGDFEKQRVSHFFDYLDSFFMYMIEHPMLDLIIRPHPLMFKVILEKRLMTGNELDELLDKVDKMPNVWFDKNEDYLISFRVSDVLICDYSSLLIEYFVSGKPIIYCDTPIGFNSDTLLMDATLYHALEWSEVKEQLTKLISGEDPQYKKRKEAIRQLMPTNAGYIGREIAEYILEDFRLAQR